MKFDMILYNQNTKKSQIILYKYRQLHYLRENGRYLWKNCRHLFFKLEVRKTTLTKQNNKEINGLIKDELI